MADGPADICLCVLFYGAEDKHFNLAQRVLNDRMRELATQNIDFRFGCNAVGPRTLDFLKQQIADHFQSAQLFYSAQNLMKYPMMRKMFYEPRIRAPVTMWFDHDSYLEHDRKNEKDADVLHWLQRVVTTVNGCNFIGSVQRGELSEEQAAWIKRQPWTNPEQDSKYAQYIIGGWWAIKTEFLWQFNFPPPDFQQKNGDRVLSAAFKHQNIRYSHFRDSVRINANDAGVEAAAARTIE